MKKIQKSLPLPGATPIEQLAKPFEEFAKLESSGGISSSIAPWPRSSGPTHPGPRATSELETAKVGILAASIASGVAGMLILFPKASPNDK